MRNKISVLASLFFVFSLVSTFVSCSKDRIEAAEQNEYSDPNDYLNSKEEEEQEYVIDSAGSCPLVGKYGTELCVAKSCLMFPNGDSVYFPYKLKLVELYTPKAMIYAQMPSVAGGSVLETDGAIKVRTFKDGVELSLRPSCYYTVKMPNSAPKDYMQSYYGFDVSTYTDWTNDPSALGVTTTNNSSFADSAGGYSNDIVKFGWLNCGVDRSNSANHTLSFVSSTDNLTNVALFVYISTTKTVMQVYDMASGAIPDASDVKIIAIGINSSDDLFSFEQTLNVTSSTDVEVTMVATTDADLTTMLDNL